MLNITSYYRNANKSYNQVPHHYSQNDHQQKNIITINAGEGVEKRELFNMVDGNVNWCCLYGETVWRSLKKLKIELPYDPAIPLLGIHLEKNHNLKRYTHPYVHSSIIYNSQDMEAT